MSPGRPALLVVIHSSALCGPADRVMGKEDAALARRFLAEDLGAHAGHLVVIGEDPFGDERRFAVAPDLADAIDDCLVRTREAGLVAEVLLGPNDGLAATLARTARRLAALVGAETTVALGGGCVAGPSGRAADAVEAFRIAGFREVGTLSSWTKDGTDYAAAFRARLDEARRDAGAPAR